jgi:hypothetical protein
MNLCSVFQPNPIFTAVTTTTLTVSGLTPAGFVKTATGAGGLLSTEAFGANTYIPYSSGTGFSYSANLTFTDPSLTCLGTIGIGASASTTGIVYANKTISYSTVFGVSGGITGSLSSIATTAIFGLDFSSNWTPPTTSSFTATSTLANLIGSQIALTATMPSSSAKNMAITNAFGVRISGVTYNKGDNATKTMTVANLYEFAAINPSLLNGATITTAYAFYDPGITVATNNWGCAINTQSYFNANVSIGKNTAPAVALDVVGGHRRTVSATKTTTYQILITDYTIVCEHATVAFTVTLPAASATTIGQIFHIKNIGAAIVSVDQTGTDTLDGYTTTAELSQWDCICIQGQSATGWIII